MGIFTSVASFVRKSLSPERKNNTVERPTTTAEDIAEEEGVEGEERPGRSRPQPLSAQASFNPFATPGRSILKPTTTPQTQVATSPAVAHATSSASKAGRSLRFDFKPFAGWGATKEESEDMDVDEPEQAKPLVRSKVLMCRVTWLTFTTLGNFLHTAGDADSPRTNQYGYSTCCCYAQLE